MSENVSNERPEDSPIDEKIRRVQDLWDEIAAETGRVPIPQSQLDEAERRYREHEKAPERALPWEDVRRRLEEL